MKQKLWLAAPLMLVAMSIYGLFSWWNGSAATTDVTTPKPVTNSVLGTETSLQNWQTASFTTVYPTTLRLLTSQENPGAAITGSYLLTSISTREDDQIGITVGTLGNNSLDETSAVKLRLNQPQTYVPTTLSYAPTGAYSFKRIDNSETGIFWRHGNQYAAVVASGASSQAAELDQTVQVIVSHWQWAQ